ncbi:MAG: flavodoxin domain-containing protein, partial [Clostridia bacterium]|nr:flavodoxin domain-containing protein [Clostridia bacterium]
ILILYATRGGSTRECAELLKQKLSIHHTPILVNAEEALPAPEGYDAVIIGSPIRMGKMNKQLKKYVKTHTESLSSMPCAVFFCCGYPRQFDEYVDIQLPRRLNCSLGYHCFGGELKPEKLKGFDKLIVRMLRSAIKSQDFEESDADHHDLPELIPENINILVEKIEKLG